jgi:uncharacterized membrane protein (DUF4010 family)
VFIATISFAIYVAARIASTRRRVAYA